MQIWSITWLVTAPVFPVEGQDPMPLSSFTIDWIMGIWICSGGVMVISSSFPSHVKQMGSKLKTEEAQLPLLTGNDHPVFSLGFRSDKTPAPVQQYLSG